MRLIPETLGQALKSRRIRCLCACLALFAAHTLLAQNAYITNVLSNTVSVIATAANTVTATITVGVNPVGVAVTPDGSKVYVANSEDNTVSVIATATNTVTATIPAGINPAGVAVTPDGSKVYVANTGSNNISVIATAGNVVTNTVTGGFGPTAFGQFIGPAPAPQTPTLSGWALFPLGMSLALLGAKKLAPASASVRIFPDRRSNELASPTA
jgi:YVTN family beta-propeller protein